jgi:hypothetical protein
MGTRNILIVLSYSLLTIAPAIAQDQRNSVSLWTEQDYFVPGNQDRNYTMGAGINLGGTWTNNPLFLVSGLRRVVDHLTGFEQRHENNLLTLAAPAADDDVGVYNFGFGVTGFTPENIGSPDIQYGDRPYSCLLFINSNRTTLNNTNQRALTTEMSIGWLGSSLGREVQSKIHERMLADGSGNRPIPKGWHHQISNGGEPTLLYRIKQRWLLNELTYDEFKVFQLTQTNEFNVGYYTNASLGLTARFGLFNTTFWQDDASFGSLGNGFISDPNVTDDPHFLGFYLFAGGRMRAVGYNALMQGQFRHSDYRMKSAEIQHIITEFELGAALKVWGFHVIYEPLAGRSAEFISPQSRSHQWGALYASFRWPN